MIKRLFDITLSIILSIAAAIPMFTIFIIAKTTSPGPAIFWSRRVGINNTEFLMPKFRTMNINTPQLATHLLENPNQHLTSIGGFLRKTSLDELPQLYSILKGDMSFVGPRPALFNQSDLIALRTKKEVHKLKPGLTGWAQISGRDNLSIQEKVHFDCHYAHNSSFIFDIKILLLTFLKVIKRDCVHH